MANMKNAKWVVKSHPEADLSEDNFDLIYEEVPEPDAGQVLIKTKTLVITPPLRMAVGSGGITGSVVPVGDMMRGTGQGEIIVSNHPDFSVGDIVSGAFGWQEYSISDGKKPFPIEKIEARAGQPLNTTMHIMGASGATAYIGFYDLAKPKPGDIVLVSAAAGTVGSIVCQLAKHSGCKVIGIAGNQVKCDFLVNELGIDGAINYKNSDVAEELKALCPKGIDIYFDNVGGEILDHALDIIRPRARVILCGATSQYEADGSWYGPKNYFNLVYREAIMQGFYIFNYRDRFPDAYRRLSDLINQGALKYNEDIVDGIESVPLALVQVLSGENFGTQLVNISQEN